MAKATYRARVYFVSGEIDLVRDTPIDSFLVPGGSGTAGSKPLELKTANDATLIAALDQAKAKKKMTVMKSPSADDLDAVLASVFDQKRAFGFNFDVYVNYTGSWIQFVHFFAEDAQLVSQPIRTGGGKSVKLKLEFAFPKGVDFKKATKEHGRWTKDDDWIR